MRSGWSGNDASRPMTDVSDTLIRQFDTAWKLASYHLDGLTTEECLWRPASRGPHVRKAPDGSWHAEWPESEGYDIGPPSIAWLTWHVGFWWSMALDHSFGDATLTRDVVTWPGSAEDACAWIGGLRAEWAGALARLSDDERTSTARTRWPFRDRPFDDVAAWVNIELTKNAAEIGYARFLYGVR
jgi:DinB superfamily